MLVGVVWSHNTNLTKIGLITTIIGNNFTGMYILIAKARSYVIQEGREKGRTKSRRTPSVYQPKQVVALRKYTVLVLDEKGFPSSPPRAGGHLSPLPIPSRTPT